MARQKLSILISPPGSGSSVELGISIRALKVLGVVAGLAVLLGLVGMGQIGSLYRKALLYHDVASENEKLRRHTEELSRLEDEMSELKAAEKDIRTLTAGALPGGMDEALRAIGGDSVYTALLKDEMSREPEVGMRWPWEGPISRGFEAGVHAGIDIAGPRGAPIVAAAAGRVDYAGWDDILGRMIVLDHGDGLRTIYGHSDSLLVTTGQLVQSGQIIARLGSTGKSSGPHVHFEVRRWEIPLPPEPFLKPRGGLATPSLSGVSTPQGSPVERGNGME